MKFRLTVAVRQHIWSVEIKTLHKTEQSPYNSNYCKVSSTPQKTILGWAKSKGNCQGRERMTFSYLYIPSLKGKLIGHSQNGPCRWTETSTQPRNSLCPLHLFVAQLVKNLPAVRESWVPGQARSPGEGKGYPLQYSGLQKSMDCIGCKDSDTTE